MLSSKNIISAFIAISCLLVNLITPGGNAYFQDTQSSVTEATTAPSTAVTTESGFHEHHQSEVEAPTAEHNHDGNEHSQHVGSHHQGGSHLGSSHCPLCVFEDDGLQVATTDFINLEFSKTFLGESSLFQEPSFKTSSFYTCPPSRAPPLLFG